MLCAGDEFWYMQRGKNKNAPAIVWYSHKDTNTAAKTGKLEFLCNFFDTSVYRDDKAKCRKMDRVMTAEAELRGFELLIKCSGLRYELSGLDAQSTKKIVKWANSRENQVKKNVDHYG